MVKRHAAWVADQEAAAREMRLANIKLQIREGVYETPARILGTVQKLQEVLDAETLDAGERDQKQQLEMGRPRRRAGERR